MNKIKKTCPRRHLRIYYNRPEIFSIEIKDLSFDEMAEIVHYLRKNKQPVSDILYREFFGLEERKDEGGRRKAEG